MPLYEWKCMRDGFKDELLMSYERSKTVEVICPHCGDAMIRLISMPAKTPTAWNGGWTDGLSHTMYSKALGRKVANRREEERIMNEQGFVAESELGEGWIEKKQAEVVERRQAQDKKTEIYQEALKETGDPVKAVERAFPTHECLDGTLDKLYDDKITI